MEDWHFEGKQTITYHFVVVSQLLGRTKLIEILKGNNWTLSAEWVVFMYEQYSGGNSF